MGLDMYFVARESKHKSYYEGIDKVDKAKYPGDLLQFDTDFINGKYIVIQKDYNICYFRKFNALHSYIVETFADGVDHCQDIYLSRSDVKQMYEVCIKVLEDRNHACDLLPTRDGCFFGSLDYDDWYFDNVKIARDFFERVLDTFDFEKYSFIYQASW